MKKILFAALILTLLATVCLSQAAFAENFAEVERTERNIAYLDTDSVKDEGDYLTAVTKITLRTPEERAKFKERCGVDAHYLLMTFAYNKRAREDQLLAAEAVYGYETTGSESNEFSDRSWRAIPEGTIGAVIYEKIMAPTK